MAIVIPIIMAYTGATTAIAGAIGLTAAIGASAAATVVSTVASIAFQVTGVNDKINKAASKVFGEDLVKVVNIAGAVYGAVNGGFNFGEGANGLTEAGGALSTKAMLDGTNAFGANSAAGAFDLNSVGSVGLGASDGDFGATTDALGNSTYMPGDANAVELSAVRAPEISKGVDLMGDGGSLGKDMKPIPESSNTSTNQSGTTAPKAALTDAARSSASATQTSTLAPNASATDAAGLKAGASIKPGSFFDKLLSNDKAVGEVIKGVGTGIVGAANSKAEKEKLAWQKQRYTTTPTTRILQ